MLGCKETKYNSEDLGWKSVDWDVGIDPCTDQCEGGRKCAFSGAQLDMFSDKLAAQIQV